MFSKLSLFRITSQIDTAAITAGLESAAFVPTTPNQQKALGFEPPRAAHGAMVEVIETQLIARATIETRKVPSDALQRRMDEVITGIEQTQGRKPGRKERAEIKDAVVDELLPQAFPRRISVPVWINPKAGILAIGSTSSAQVDDITTAMVRSIDGLTIARLTTVDSPASAMAAWLLSPTGATDDGLEVGLACELRANDETNAVTRYQGQRLDREDVRTYIRSGYRPTSLAMCFDGCVSFTLTDSLELKKIEFIDVQANGGEDDDHFDADATLATMEMRAVIAHLIDALGGLGGLAELTVEPPEGEPDPMIDRARAAVLDSGRASINYVQRTLLIGYNRAARLLEALESEGTISPMRPDGSRTITNPKGATK
jgi:recombination associated protein RdgC